MMNIFVILAFSVLLPSSILCGVISTSENKSLRIPNEIISPLHSKNSTQTGRNVIVKREIPAESNDILYPDYRNSELKRSAAGLNKFIYVLRNSFDKSAASPQENEVGSKESDVTSGDVTRTLAQGNSIDRFPAALVERRGQQTQKDRKIYLRCYFNAVSCFKKRK